MRGNVVHTLSQIIGTPVAVEVRSAGSELTHVRFVTDNSSALVLTDTPEALVATLTEALEAVDRAWRASRGEVTP